MPRVQLSSALCVVSSSFVLETLCFYIVVSRLSLSTKCHHCVSMNTRSVFLTVFVLNPAPSRCFFFISIELLIEGIAC